MPDPASPFWNPSAQTMPDDRVREEARAGVAREWQRIWDLPVEFYRNRFESAGLNRREVPPLDEIPRTTKNDLRADETRHPPFGTHRVVGLRDAVRIGGSMGTSGTPVILMFGPGDIEPAIEHQCRGYWRYGVRPNDSFTHSWPQGFYMSSTFTALWFTRIPLLEIPVGPPTSVDVAADHLRLWFQLRPDGFQMTSAQLQTYEDAARRENMDLREIFEDKPVGLLDSIFQFEAPRRSIEDRYGFRMRNMGGVAEIPGFGVTDCSHHAGLHVPGDYVLPQVVDPQTGREVPDGERGHLVLNAFGFDQLILRYDVEDICTMTWEPCPCGETGPRYTLLGRALDAVTVDGRTILPIDAQLALTEAGAPEVQFAAPAEQDGAALRIRIEGSGQASRYEEVLREGLDVPVQVHEVEPGSLPRSSFKPRRISS